MNAYRVAAVLVAAGLVWSGSADTAAAPAVDVPEVQPAEPPHADSIVRAVSDATWSYEVTAADQPCIVLFRSSKNPHLFDAVFADLARRKDLEDVKFLTLDTDRNNWAPSWYDIHTLPTVLVFTAGAVDATIAGDRDAAGLEAELAKYVG